MYALRTTATYSRSNLLIGDGGKRAHTPDLIRSHTRGVDA